MIGAIFLLIGIPTGVELIGMLAGIPTTGLIGMAGILCGLTTVTIRITTTIPDTTIMIPIMGELQPLSAKINYRKGILIHL